MEPTLSFEELQNRLGYRFVDPELLLEALTHKSYRNEHPVQTPFDNERLEFLGDAVLDLAVSRYLYRSFPELTEGELTRIRAEVVHEAGIAELGQKLNIGSYLRLGRGEERTGGRTKPSLLADATEALLGALFCDAGYERCEPLLIELFQPAIERSALRKQALDSKSVLQEFSQARFGRPPRYVLVGAEGPDHARCFRAQVFVGDALAGEGEGRTKKAAQQQAAQAALDRLGTDGER